MALRRFPPDRFISKLERQLITQLDTALESAFGLPIPDPDKEWTHRRPNFSGSDWGVHAFFELMQFSAPEGFTVGARVLFEGLEEREADRALVSFVLTRIARMVYESPHLPDRPPRESEVGFMGQFVVGQLEHRWRELVEWFEDMHDGNDVCGLLAQPVQIPRGVLMSPHFDHRRAERFWNRAYKKARFPANVFSEPCMPEEGELFSPFQRRRFGEMFSQMPEAAALWFAAHMRDEARTRMVWKQDGDKRVLETCVMEDGARLAVLRSVSSYVTDDVRRQKVHDVLFPPPPPPDSAPPPSNRRKLPVLAGDDA